MFSLLTTENLLLPATSVIIVLAVLAYLIRSGLFRKIEISTREPARGSLTVCYKTGRGSHKGKYS
jgi:hypothetical protein